MTTAPGDFARRLEQLERAFEELTTTVSRPVQPPHDLAEQISFRAWMKISAPTFALMALGFILLWNAQQASSSQLYEMSRSLGRLDGAIDRFESTMVGFDERLSGFDERLLGIDERLSGIDERLASFDRNLERFASSVTRLGEAVEKLATRS